MKTLLTGALMLLLSVPSFAQTNGTTSAGYQPFTLPANPSARQITKLLIETTEGIHDPFAVLRKIGSMGNAVVPALKTLLFAPEELEEGGELLPNWIKIEAARGAHDVRIFSDLGKVEPKGLV